MAERNYLVELTLAEQRANDIIRRAQEAREKRLKEAKYDAEQELSKLREDHELEYQKGSTKSDTGEGSELENLRQDYVRKQEEVYNKYQANKGKGLEFLLDKLFEVKISVPAVVKGKFS